MSYHNRTIHGFSTVALLIFLFSFFTSCWDPDTAYPLELLSEKEWERNFGIRNNIFGKHAIWISEGNKGFLQIRIPAREHYGASLKYSLHKNLGSEPEELYLRYDLKFDKNWNPDQMGKLPGFAGTYGKGGWGGRTSDGENGWSVRGFFQPSRDGKTPVGFYVYHSDMKGKYGDEWMWNNDPKGSLEKERWYTLVYHIKLNDITRNNGILEGWIDGKLLFSKSDLSFRRTKMLKIESVWLNIYLGGKRTDPYDNTVFIRNLQISDNTFDLDD